MLRYNQGSLSIGAKDFNNAIYNKRSTGVGDETITDGINTWATLGII